jgi:hypothetical protein
MAKPNWSLTYIHVNINGILLKYHINVYLCVCVDGPPVNSSNFIFYMAKFLSLQKNKEIFSNI